MGDLLKDIDLSKGSAPETPRSSDRRCPYLAEIKHAPPR